MKPSLESILREAVTFEAHAFDEGQDISGAELVQWFVEWRGRARRATRPRRQFRAMVANRAMPEVPVCLVCGAAYDTGAILIDRRLHASLEKYTTTGWGLCPEHRRLYDDGFVALVECDPERSGKPTSADLLKPDEVYRTGRVAHLKQEAFRRVCDLPIKQDLPCVFVEPGVIERLQATVKP